MSTKKNLSGIEAAVVVLRKARKPLKVAELTERAVNAGWRPAGATPSQTLSATLQRAARAAKAVVVKLNEGWAYIPATCR